MSNELKNHYGENTSWFCLDASITLLDQKEDGSFVIDDEVEIYGENEEGQEGSASICVVSLLESAHVVIDEKDREIERLNVDKEMLIKSGHEANKSLREDVDALTEHLRLKEAECEELAKDKAEFVEMLSEARNELFALIDEVNDQRMSRVHSQTMTPPELHDQESVYLIDKLLNKHKGE